MKGLKSLEIHNYWGEAFLKAEFDRDGNQISNTTQGVINYFTEYVLQGKFLTEKLSIRRRYTYHKPKKHESPIGRIKNLYMALDFYTKSGKPSFIEIYVYEDHSKDNLFISLDGVGMKFMFDEDTITEELYSLIMGQLIDTVDL